MNIQNNNVGGDNSESKSVKKVSKMKMKIKKINDLYKNKIDKKNEKIRKLNEKIKKIREEKKKLFKIKKDKIKEIKIKNKEMKKKDREIKKKKKNERKKYNDESYKDNGVMTMTFSEVVENQTGMEMIGEISDKGFSYENLICAKGFFEKMGSNCELVCLNELIKDIKVKIRCLEKK